MDMSSNGAGMAHNNGSGHTEMGMQMYFHASSQATILFKGWTTTNWWQMFLSCIVIIVFATLYEGFKVLREKLDETVPVSRSSTTSSISLSPKYGASDSNQMIPTADSSTSSLARTMLNNNHLIQVPLHVLQQFLSYCLMLIFMTFNIWLGLSILLGAGLGYFLFAWKRKQQQDVNEHCN